MSRKPLKAIRNNAGGYDLLTERDAGNEIRILTGTESRSIEYWTRLQSLTEDVLWELQHAIPHEQKRELNA